MNNTPTENLKDPGHGGRQEAESRLSQLGFQLPQAPRPLGIYTEAVLSGELLFLSGMLPTRNGKPAVLGRVGAELTAEGGSQAANLAALNALAVAREHLGSLNRVRRLVRLGVSIVTAGDFRDHPLVADGASELFQQIFGSDMNPCRLVCGVASLPLGVPVALEVIFQVSP